MLEYLNDLNPEPVSYLLDTQASVHLDPATWSALVGSAIPKLNAKHETLNHNHKLEA